MFTPGDLELLLHCHYSVDPHPRLNAPAIQEGIKKWGFYGMIERTDTDVFTTTSRGRAWIEYLLSTPLPEENWVVPERKKKCS